MKMWAIVFLIYMYGEIDIGVEQQRVMVELYFDRSSFDSLFDAMVDLDDDFYADAPRELIAGRGQILGQNEYREYGYHMFVVVVSEKIYSQIVKYADLAIEEGKGVFKCQLSFPGRIANSKYGIPRDSELPVIEYRFQYDSIR